MGPSVRDWTLWVSTTLATIPASLVVWFIGGVAMCGEEVYITPPGSVGYSLCNALVEPIAPWVALASIPTLLTAIGGFIALRRRTWRLLWVLLVGAYLLAFLIVLAFLASF